MRKITKWQSAILKHQKTNVNSYSRLVRNAVIEWRLWFGISEIKMFLTKFIQSSDVLCQMFADFAHAESGTYSACGDILIYTVFQKSDAKIQITITTAYLIRINYPLSSFHYRLSGTNVANFNKIHLMVSEQQLFKERNWWKFDGVLTKINLLSFFGTRCSAGSRVLVLCNWLVL